MHGVHHPSADIDRLYAPCSDGGTGLQQIESTYQSCIVRLNCYLADSSNPFIQMIRKCDSGKSSHSIKRIACRFIAQLWRSLASDDKSQSLYRNASISVEGGFEQAPETRCETLPYVLQFSSCAVLEREAYARAVSPSH